MDKSISVAPASAYPRIRSGTPENSLVLSSNKKQQQFFR